MLEVMATPCSRPRLVGRPHPRLIVQCPVGRKLGALVTCSKRTWVSKVDNIGAVAPEPAAASSPPPYGEALLAREYELWQRQAAMYERLLEQADHEQQRFAEERASWQATEAALRQEAAELRAQLLYILAQLNSLQAGGGMAAPGPAAASCYVGSSQQVAIAGREPAAALPSSSISSPAPTATLPAKLSPAEQVKMVVDAMKVGGGAAPAAQPPPPPPASIPSSSSSSAASPSTAWPEGAEAELPPYAADLAAAVAAVENTDVLSGVGGYSLRELRATMRSGAASSSTGAPAQELVAAVAPQPAAAAAPPPPALGPLPSTAVAAAAAAADPAVAEEAGVPQGPHPALTLGADDIFWVNQLHKGLVDLGYFPGDADIDDFYFGDGTQNALMTMQCCEGLEETGVTDAATWAKLLGPELRLKLSRDLTADMMINVPGLSSLGSSGSSEAAAAEASSVSMQQLATTPPKPAYAELFSAAYTDGMVVSGMVAVSQEVQLGVGSEQVGGKVQVAHQETYTEWPVLLEGDGGREVHALQVALERAGFYPSEDDMRWWCFGDSTLSALRTFQACNSYPESGVCDATTWRLLLGKDASPADLLSLCTGDSADEDLAEQNTDRMWLLGEQRWEDRSRVKRS